MSEIFLSAGVPIVGRGNYHETADPFLIQCAVREFVIAVIQNYKIVWGGHPAITPMIWSICQDLNIEYSNSVVLYQSRFFEDRYPEENKLFGNVVFVDGVPDNREASLLRMREAMLSRKDLKAAVFIGGMDGVEAEYKMFLHFHPDGKILPVPATGGAALQLAEQIGRGKETLWDADFARLFKFEFPVLDYKKYDLQLGNSLNYNLLADYKFSSTYGIMNSSGIITKLPDYSSANKLDIKIPLKLETVDED